MQTQQNSVSDAYAGENDEASSGMDAYIQTQGNSDSYASPGANDVSSSGLYKRINHQCNTDIKNNDYSQSYETPHKKLLFLLFW